MKAIEILEKHRLLIQTFFVIILLWLWYFLYYFYTELNIKNCWDWEIFSWWICIENTINKTPQEEIGQNNWYWTYYLNLWWTYSENHDISKYKKIKINENIDGLRIFITIDFPTRFKEKYSSYTTSNGFKFALKYFLGENWFDEEWWFYNVLRNSSCSNLINDPPKGLDWAIVWNDINWWHTRVLDLTKKTKIAFKKDKCKPWLQYTYTNTLEFINKNIWKELYVWWYLSHVWKWANHWPIKGREVSLIKEIKIEYIWNDWAIEIVQ
jgi:hypothetical protein